MERRGEGQTLTKLRFKNGGTTLASTAHIDGLVHLDKWQPEAVSDQANSNFTILHTLPTALRLGVTVSCRMAQVETHDATTPGSARR